jgi:hypothetical protein
MGLCSEHIVNKFEYDGAREVPTWIKNKFKNIKHHGAEESFNAVSLDGFYLLDGDTITLDKDEVLTVHRKNGKIVRI